MKVIEFMNKVDSLVGYITAEKMKEFAKLMVDIRRDPEFWEEIIKLARD